MADNCVQEPPRLLGHTITATQGGKLLLFGGYQKSGYMNLPGCALGDHVLTGNRIVSPLALILSL